MSVKEEVKKLIKALNNNVFEVRKNAIWELGEMGGKAKEAIPALLTSLNDKQDELRYLATFALDKIGKEVIPLLIKDLECKDINTSSGASYILGRIGREIKIGDKVALAIIETLNDQKTDENSNEDLNICNSYISILDGLRVEDHQISKTIFELLKDYD